MSHCVRHFEETMEAACRTCRAPFCSRCLVYAFGPNKPPFCIGCALNAGGVRNGYKVAPAVAEKPSRREVRAAARSASKPQRSSRWRRGSEPAEPLPAASAAPIQFDSGWIESVSHDAHTTTPQIPSLLRTAADHDFRHHV